MNTSRLLKKVLCPFHNDTTTPNCAIYDDYHYNCYACGANGLIKNCKLGIYKYFIECLDGAAVRPALDLENAYEEARRKYNAISLLPTKEIRGIKALPYDQKYFYILYPDCCYYVGRLLPGVNSSYKYLCPSGIPRPSFTLRGQTKDTLIIVEGELNALSIHQVLPEITVTSPGSGPNLRRVLPFYQDYDNILVIADDDPAGRRGSLELVSQIGFDKVKVKLMPKSMDANDILVNYGQDRLKEEIQRTLYGC